MDYLKKRFGVCARKPVYYYLDKADQKTNVDIRKWHECLKHSQKKDKTTLQRGAMVCLRVPSLQAAHPSEWPLT